MISPHFRNMLHVLTSVILLFAVTSPISIAYGQSEAENEGQSTNATEPITFTATSIGNIDENAYDAKITWTPADIGKPNKFHVEIFDANQLEPRSPKAVSYDIKIYQGDKYLLPLEPMGNNAQLNEDFSQDFTFVFLQEGSYVLAIEEIEHEGENIRIPIQVTPEFPFGIFVTIAGLFACMIAATRLSSFHSRSQVF
jgi:hypothetical protein